MDFIFHLFVNLRFNNPKSIQKRSNSDSNLGVPNDHQFKDYQFAKNEIERKQNEIIQARLNEALSKCKLDGDQKLKQLEQQYQKDIQSYVRPNSNSNFNRSRDLINI